MEENFKLIERGIRILTLRKGVYEQTQLIIIPPYTKIPKHRHPNVSKFVKIIFGGALCGRGEKEKYVRVDDNESKLYFIPEGRVHWVETREEPLIYLSIQTWKGGEVKSIEEDWEGETL